MLNPRQLAERIDRCIAASAADTQPLDVNAVTERLLASLDRSDRIGLDPVLVRERVLARGIGLPAIRW